MSVEIDFLATLLFASVVGNSVFLTLLISKRGAK